MGMENAIIIKQSYFNGIKVAIDAMNAFFESGFTTKNFPTVGEDYDLDPTIERIITRLDAIDPTWLKDETKYTSVINMINDAIAKIDPENGIYQTLIDQNNEALLSAIDGYVGIKMLNAIADHFDDFTKLINGIYTFELFTKTSQFTEAINQFSQFLQWNEMPELDLEEKIFDEGLYVQGIFKEGLITLPDNLTIESETERIVNRQDLQGVEIYVDDEEDTVQEAAEINYFASYKPAHMKYNNSSRKFIISNEFTAVVDEFVSGLRKCDSTDDLKNFFNESMSKYAKMFGRVIVPCILVRVLTNPKKCSVDYDKDVFKRYTDSYRSILDQNTGARRFENYDIFTTFKTDKEGTIKFINDFFKLKLVNDKDAAISNNTLLTLFNIFDSRIYLDLVYNLAPEAIKNEQNENQFVTSTRAGINKNSRSQNAYSDKDEDKKKDEKEDKKPETPEAVTEYVSKELDKLGDMSISDMRYNEHFQYLIRKEIDTLDQKIYNEGVSAFDVYEYVGESFTAVNPEPDEFVMEADITKRRERLQSTIASLMTAMEEIVELDNRKAWNNNTFVHRSSTSGGILNFLFPNAYGSSKVHTDIKQTYFQTAKAIKGKTGGLTPEQKNTLLELHQLVGNIWLDVKKFWINPVNYTKKLGLFVNDKKGNISKRIAQNAHAIVNLKPKLDFILDENFVNEAWYDGSPDYVFQEATSEANRERLNTSISVVMNDFKQIVALDKKKAWSNNEAITMFARKSKVITDIKQAIKYSRRAIGTSAGKLDDSQKSSLESLEQKLIEILKAASFIRKNPLIGKNIKESGAAKKIAMLAGEVVGMESSLSFTKDKPIEDRSLPHQKKPEAATKSSEGNESTTTTESFEVNIPTFEEFIAEAYDGSVPNYMRERFKITDKLKTTLEKADIPDIPYNPVPDLADSIDTKVDTSGDQLDSMLGSGFEESDAGKEAKEKGNTVINITYNYTNSFNKNSNNTTDDHSTGKTITNTTINGTGKGSNNNNNSNGSVDTKDSNSSRSSSNKKKLSSGKTIEEMFALLESKEPQSIVTEASDVPKETLLTKAYDRDKKSLAKQQENKRKAQTVAGTTKAVFKPTLRLKNWLTGMVDSLINRDEDKVKHELLENPSYRSAVFKAMRLALRFGLVGVAFSIQPWLGVGLLGANVARSVDKQRLKRELRRELETELKIIDQKIDDLGSRSYSDTGANEEKYKLMRMKTEIQKKIIQLGGSATAFGKTRDSLYY